MTIHRNHFKTSALALALCVALPAFASADEVGVSVGKHHFTYYKDHDIYFAPETKVYYWNENGNWRSGVALPSDQQRYITSGGIDVELDTTKPYERHDYVVTHYKNLPATTTRESSTTMNNDGSTTTTTTTTTKHQYVYYADHDIYFAPDTKTYYWRTNGTWTSGAALPPEDTAFVRSKGISIELDTDKPYERHDYVIAHYKNKHVRDDD
jgi:hypothetical protein